jgi:hypothetical protein
MIGWANSTGRRKARPESNTKIVSPIERCAEPSLDSCGARVAEWYLECVEKGVPTVEEAARNGDLIGAGDRSMHHEPSTKTRITDEDAGRFPDGEPWRTKLSLRNP